MNCSKCHGLMVNDRIFDPEEAIFDLSVWRCLNCGETVDPLILKNRLKQEQESSGPAHKSGLTGNKCQNISFASVRNSI